MAQTMHSSWITCRLASASSMTSEFIVILKSIPLRVADSFHSSRLKVQQSRLIRSFTTLTANRWTMSYLAIHIGMLYTTRANSGITASILLPFSSRLTKRLRQTRSLFLARVLALNFFLVTPKIQMQCNSSLSCTVRAKV